MYYFYSLRTAAARFVAGNVGRLYVGLIGGVVVVWALVLPADRNTVANTAIVVGASLVALGGLVPWFRHARWKSASLEFEDPEIQRTRAGVARAVASEQKTPGVAIAHSAAIDATRNYAATMALAAVCEDAARQALGFKHCRFRLFMYDAQQDELTAVLTPPGQGDLTKSWKPREGVTGVAYSTGEYAIAVGEETHDETFGLSDEARRSYAHLTEVAAAPVLNASRKVIGVLSVSHDTGERILSTASGRKIHMSAAAAAARVIVDLLGWRSDD